MYCAILLSILTCLNVYFRLVTFTTLLTWLGSIVLFLLLFYDHNKTSTFTLTKKESLFLFTTALASLIILYYFGSIPTHFHQDEFFNAYASYFLPSIWKLDWFAGYPMDFFSPYALFFYIFQKPVLHLLGPSIFAIRASIWGYAIISLIYIFALTKYIYDARHAYIASILYIFLAPNVYYSSFGMSNIVSTTAFLATSFHTLIALKYSNKNHTLLAGIYAGITMLAHPSSYIAIPIISLLSIYHAIHQKSWQGITILLRMLIVTCIILLPFIVHAYSVQNYFVARTNQVNIITGSWEHDAQQISLKNLLIKQVANSVKSIYTEGIGGRDNFNFGHLALFDQASAISIAIGLFIFLSQFIKNRRTELFFILIGFFVPAILGFVFTVHPPPFHRVQILNPFFAIFITLPLLTLANILNKHKMVQIICIVISTGILLYTNFIHARTMISKDADMYPQNTRVIGEYINQHYPIGTTIPIASFSTFHGGKELFFRTGGNYVFPQEETAKILSTYIDGPLILLQPTNEVITKLKAQHPNYTLLNSINNVSLRDLQFFVPPNAK